MCILYYIYIRWKSVVHYIVRLIHRSSFSRLVVCGLCMVYVQIVGWWVFLSFYFRFGVHVYSIGCAVRGGDRFWVWLKVVRVQCLCVTVNLNWFSWVAKVTCLHADCSMNSQNYRHECHDKTGKRIGGSCWCGGSIGWWLQGQWPEITTVRVCESVHWIEKWRTEWGLMLAFLDYIKC